MCVYVNVYIVWAAVIENGHLAISPSNKTCLDCLMIFYICLYPQAFNTFIDDVFAFIITMPTSHRLACFRDDAVFIIYLYQRWWAMFVLQLCKLKCKWSLDSRGKNAFLSLTGCIPWTRPGWMSTACLMTRNQNENHTKSKPTPASNQPAGNVHTDALKPWRGHRHTVQLTLWVIGSGVPFGVGLLSLTCACCLCPVLLML